MPQGWTNEDEAPLRSRWRTLTVEEIRSRKEVAREKIVEAMQELYLGTGIDFKVSSKIYHGDELNNLTHWIRRSHYGIDLTGTI